MARWVIDAAVCLGSVLMAYNIYSYIGFSRHVRARGSWEKEGRLFNVPIVLLILFLIGYLAVGLSGQADLVMAGILLGGSVFVLLMLVVIRRTVDRIEQNERLEAKMLAAEEASRAKTFFLSNMSHDIRTPLNAIIGYTTLAGRGDATPEDKDSYLKKIDRAGRQLLDIVNDVLEMSRIESGKLELTPEPVDLEVCVRETEDLVRTQLEGRRIRFSVDLRIEHRYVLCDRPLLTRALMNLLCNAGKFTPEGPGDGQTGRYCLRIRDTGIGMSPEFVENLFKPFEREKTSTVSGIQGTGLGMAITKGIVDLMGGAIRVDTRPGEGTEFIIDVPFRILEDQIAPDPAQAQGLIERFDGFRALLVEDNPVNMEIAQLLLEQAGFVIDRAENGKEALNRVSAAAPGTYDVVLMDVRMPVMNGYDAARAIRALPDAGRSGVPIVAMTANAFQDDVRAAAEAGMNGHIAKPLDIRDMMTTLKAVLKEK